MPMMVMIVMMMMLMIMMMLMMLMQMMVMIICVSQLTSGRACHMLPWGGRVTWSQSKGEAKRIKL
jgi:hypothetical protein